MLPALLLLPALFAQSPAIGFVEIAAGERYAAPLAGGCVLVEPGRIALVADGAPAISLRVPAHGLVAGDPKPGRIHFLIGDDPSRFLVDRPHFATLRLTDVAPGVDLVARADGGRFEYDLELARGADLASLSIRCEGALGLALEADGTLRIDTARGPLRQTPPVTYALGADGRRASRNATTWIDAAADPPSFGFRADDAAGEPLLLDPGLAFASYLGGLLFDEARGCAVGADGNLYLCGSASSANFPVTPGAFDPIFGLIFSDAFVAKVDGVTGQLVYATFLGGSGTDSASAIAVTAANVAVVCGRTQSTNFPTSSTAFDKSANGLADAFVVGLNAAGSGLAFGTYLGGSAFDEATAVEVDAAGQVFVAGTTGSFDLPVTAGVLDPTFNGGGELLTDAFVTRFDASASALGFATYLGGSGIDEARGLALLGGDSVVVGRTESADFPVTATAVDATFNGGLNDAFVARVSASGATLVHGTFLGGTDMDQADAVCADANRVIVGGGTRSGDFFMAGGFDSQPGGGEDGFFMEFDPSLGLRWSSFLGGAADDHVFAIALDPTGAPFLTGRTASSDFPALQQSYDPSFNGGTDAFFTKAKAGGSGLNESGFLGGSGADEGYAIAVGTNGLALLCGRSASSNLPLLGAIQALLGGSSDAFFAALPTAICSNPPSIAVYGAGKPGASGIPVFQYTGVPKVPSSDFVLKVTNGLPGALPLLLAGFQSASLKFDEGMLLVAPQMVMPLVPFSIQGRVELPVAVTSDSGLCGLTIYLQAIYSDPAASGYYGTAQTNGVVLTFGS